MLMSDSWWTNPMSREEFDRLLASRAEIQRASKFGGFTTYVNIILDHDERGLRAQRKRGIPMTCSSLDHQWPIIAGRTPEAGTPCFCGARKWAVVETARPVLRITLDSTRTAASPAAKTSEPTEGTKIMTTDTQPEVATPATTLKRRAILGGGIVAYALEGVRGSVTISKSMFADPSNPPEELQFSSLGFAQPTIKAPAAQEDEKVKAERIAAREAKKAELAQKAEERAQAARARAEKALKLAQEAEARSAKLKGTTPTVTEPEAVPV